MPQLLKAINSNERLSGSYEESCEFLEGVRTYQQPLGKKNTKKDLLSMYLLLFGMKTTVFSALLGMGDFCRFLVIGGRRRLMSQLLDVVFQLSDLFMGCFQGLLFVVSMCFWWFLGVFGGFYVFFSGSFRVCFWWFLCVFFLVVSMSCLDFFAVLHPMFCGLL